MRRVTSLAVLLLAACPSSGPKRVGDQPSWRGGGNTSSIASVKAPSPVTFAPSREAATRYNEPFKAAPRSEIGDAIIAAVRDAAVKAGTPVPAADARLFRACEELAAIVPPDDVVSYNLVEFALQRNGIIEPSPNLLVVWGDIDSPQQIVEQLQPRLAEILADGANARVGIGAVKRQADGTGAVVFALQGSGVSTSPIPRQLAAGGSFTLDAVVDARYHEPEVFVTHDDGTTERLDLKMGRAGGFTAQVRCGKRTGRQQIEITASDQRGSTVLANFPQWCGVTPPESLTVASSRDEAPITQADAAEQRLLALVNRDRLAAGLPGLQWDERVADVARGHSEEMRRTKNVAHISPTTGSAADRVRAANIKTALVLENVARAYGIGEAHEGLMNSPGHRANVMSTSATHIGIGIVFGEEVSGRREVFVTQVFTRVPPKVDPQRAAQTVFQRIDATHHVNNAARLSGLAQQLADALAAGKTREQGYALIKKPIDGLGNQYSRVGSVITAAGDLDTVDGPGLLGDAKPDDVGIGIAQGPHPEIGERALWIVVLLGQKR